MELNIAEKYLLENLLELAKNGCVDENPRPRYESDGIPAHSLFINQVVMKYDIAKGEFPISEARPLAYRNAIKEILAFYQDQTNKLSVFVEKYKLFWWNRWRVKGTDTIGQRYGHTVKRYNLMNKLLKGLKSDPFGRRHIISLWQEQEFIDDEKGLKPCAFLSMFTVRKVKDVMYLDLTLVQRSSDFPVAGFINQIQYVAFLMMVAKHCGFQVGTFMHVIQNFHIYTRHLSNAEELTKRIVELKKRKIQSKPQLILNVPDGTNFYDITVDDFKLVDYNPIEPQLSFELAI